MSDKRVVRLIAVTGGIGSGKSVVCRILAAMGYNVYDCDSRAKQLMDSDDTIKQRIACEIGADCVDPVTGCIMRQALADRVFSNDRLLERINDITHSAVRADLALWHRSQSRAPMAFVETAILYQSGLDKMVDEVWHVTAPLPLRIERVMKRSNLSRPRVEARIAAQDGFCPEAPHPRVHTIDNSPCRALLPQINSLIYCESSGRGRVATMGGT